MTHSEQDSSARDLIMYLRMLVGKPVDETAREQLATSMIKLLPDEIDLNVAGWITWSILGLDLFSADPRSLSHLQSKARGMIVGMAMLRTNANITAASKMLGTSRRALRHGLRSAGLYPWPGNEQHDQNGGEDLDRPQERGDLATVLLAYADVLRGSEEDDGDAEDDAKGAERRT